MHIFKDGTCLYRGVVYPSLMTALVSLDTRRNER